MSARPGARVAGAVALLAVLCALASLLVALSAVQADTGAGAHDHAQALTNFDQARGAAAIATALRALGIALVAVPALFLARAARAPRWLLWLGVGAPLFLALATVLGHVALSDVADQFAAGGTATKERADELIDRSGLYGFAGALQLLGRIAFGAWLVLACAAALRAGLLTAFLAYYGYGAAAAFLLAPYAGDALFAGWLGSLALLALGWWPGGRPEGWDAAATDASG